VNQPILSVVIPVLNEADNLQSLHERLTASLEEIGKPYEIIFVDDGSTDTSPVILENLFHSNPEHVRVVQFRRNFGKTAAR
jgi:undecaprenyl-phosphate 4-deoxy-4-formamido-L-arabinose transferase